LLITIKLQITWQQEPNPIQEQAANPRQMEEALQATNLCPLLVLLRNQAALPAQVALPAQGAAEARTKICLTQSFINCS